MVVLYLVLLSTPHQHRERQRRRKKAVQWTCQIIVDVLILEPQIDIIVGLKGQRKVYTRKNITKPCNRDGRYHQYTVRNFLMRMRGVYPQEKFPSEMKEIAPPS